MLTSLLGSLIGFGGSAVPALIDVFKQKQDNKQEIEKMKVMAELRAQGYDHDLKMYETMGADKEHDRLIQHDIAISKTSGFIGALQRSVRPVITYLFFGLFIAIEVVLLKQVLELGTPVDEAILVLWDDNTQGIFAAIVSFWFGSRAIDKMRK